MKFVKPVNTEKKVDKSAILDKSVAFCIYGMIISLIVVGLLYDKYVWYVLTLIVFISCYGFMSIVPMIRYNETVMNAISNGENIGNDEIVGDKRSILILAFIAAIFETITIMSILHYIVTHVKGLIS